MTPFAVVVCAGIAVAAAVAGCTDGTTPDCSGNPSPCGYPQAPGAADAGGSTSNGAGTDGGSGDVLGG
jgi:hypothetical protein